MPQNSQNNQIVTNNNKDQFLKKNNCLIHISGEGSLAQKKLFNVLLFLAFNDLNKVTRHKKDLSQVIDLLGYDPEINRKRFKNDLIALSRIVVTWTETGNSEYKWAECASSLLSFTKFTNNKIEYQFSEGLIDLLVENSSYTRLNLGMQTVFSSKYSLILYEFCKNYFRQKDDYGQTPFYSVQQWRTLFGLEDKEYFNIKQFNQWVMKIAIDEINTKTDIFLELEDKRENRKIVAIRFMVKPNDSNSDFHKKLDPVKQLAIEQAKIIEQKKVEIEDQNIVETIKQALTFGIPKHLIEKWITNKGVTYVKEKIDLLTKKNQKSKIVSPVGYIIKALQEDWQDEDIIKEQVKSIDEIEKRKKNPETIMVSPLEFEDETAFYEEISKLEQDFYSPRWIERDMEQAERNWAKQMEV
jgi:plasmid replication initiation protein